MPRPARALAALCLGLALSGAYADAPPAASPQARYDYAQDIFHPVFAARAMVASEHALATRVGVDVMRQGGNAVDAAVAVGLALAVVLPNAGNLGGGGFLLFHDAARRDTVALDFRETAPARASRDMYLDEAGQVVPGRSLDTHLAVGVPGTVAGLAHAHRRWGTLPLATLAAPAIRLAERGFAVSPTLARMLEVERERLGRWPSSRAVFFRDGRPLRAGETLVQRDLARSLRLIARDGEAAFYRGAIADAIVAEMARHGGLIGAADLRAYRVVERRPVEGEYRGYRVQSMPPPSSGGTHIVQLLKLVERYPLAQLGANSAQTVHYLAEAMKLAYADRAEYLGDPDFTRVPVAALTSRAYADALARRIDPARPTPSAAIRPGRPQDFESPQTTHYSIVDARGNAVAVTYTLNLNFGSGIVAAGTGILLNNEMDDFSAKPGVPNAFGLIGGEANAIAPGKRPLSSMSPTLVLKDGRPWLVTGSPGGARIITTTLQTVINAIDFGMNPAESAATPRVHHQWLPDELRVEKGLSADTLALLRQRGHTVVVRPTMGRTQTIQFGPDGLYGASDPRNPDGAAAGF
ncbi:gamma-glutamyltransferase [Crenobacter luteus]|uniref:Glutathione hydrolase proenzyme n=1 Tax=Crenobacter luteus TaxID=1452487 RepID=A0A165F8C5_9NEIS|nr:gamma-glutamyltransferase [Crenobacter luteus]KZE32449.1 gamma-glutamyltranspeptidase [Crenobacter luteus]